MNKKEKALSLRIINQLIKSYTKINFSLSPALEEPSGTAILTPSWLVNIKQELIFGKYISLQDVISKINATLQDSLREFKPELFSICRVLMHEQILLYEVQKLPRSLKNKCKPIIQETKNKSDPKTSKKSVKRSGKKSHFTLPSFLLNNAINNQDNLKDGKVCSSSPTKADTEVASNLKRGRKTNPRDSKARKRPAISDTSKQNNKNSPKTNKKSVCKIVQTQKPKTIPAKNDSHKTPSASLRSQTRITDKADCKSSRRLTRIKKLITAQKNKSKTVKKPERVKLGKRKLPLNDNTEESGGQSCNTEKSPETVENNFCTDGQPSKKLKRMTRKAFGRNLFGKKKHSSGPPEEMNTFNNQILDHAENSDKNLLATTAGVRTSTPIKCSSASTSFAVVPHFKEMPGEQSVTEIVIETVHHENETTGKTELVVEKIVPLDLSVRKTKGGGKGKLSKQIWKKRRSSKFQKKGNQLMGIEEEEIPDAENDCGKSTDARDNCGQVAIVEGGFTMEVGPKNKNIEVMDYEHTPRTQRSPSKNSNQQMESLTSSHSMDEVSSNDILLSSDKGNDSELQVLKVVKPETFLRIKRKILRLLDKVEGKDSDVMVEKVIINETISDDEVHDEQPIGSLVEKECMKDTNGDEEGNSSFPKKVLSISNSPVIALKRRPLIGKKRMVKVYGKKDIENTDLSLLTEKTTDDELPANDWVSNNFNKTLDESLLRNAEEWRTTELMLSGNISEEISSLPEVPEISCFLHVCQKALRLPFFTHFEFEHSLIIPHASCLMATVVTALLSGAPSIKETKICSPLPYLQWNRKLTARLSHWFLIYKRLKHVSKVEDLIGLEPTFWKKLGTKRNPLSLKPFHQLPILQRAIILKGLCDHLFHVSKRIQTSFMSSCRGGREAKWLGEDSQGTKYLHIPVLLRQGIGDLRIYCVNNPKEELFKEIETSNALQEEQTLMIKNDHKEKPKNDSAKLESSDKGHEMDEMFYLVADSITKLNALVMTICSPFSEKELMETTAKLDREETNKDTSNQESVTLKEEELEPTEICSDLNNSFSINEQLFLAAELQSLAKDMKPMEKVLKKSQAAALVKLHLEWIEFHKDGFCIAEKANVSDKKHSKGFTRRRSKVEEKDQQDDNFEEPPNIKSDQQSLPMRKSLSRKAKSNAGKLMLEEDIITSRKEILAEMEEKALLGSSNLAEEELKWDTSLWADEDSEDDVMAEESLVEDSIWYGYAAIQEEATQKRQTPQITSATSGNRLSPSTEQKPRTVKNYTRKMPFAMGKKQPRAGTPLKHILKIGQTTRTKIEVPTDAQNEIKILSEKSNGVGLNSYKIKIKKEDLDSCLDKNKPELLINLARKSMVRRNHMNQNTNLNEMSFTQAHSSNNNSTSCLDTGNGLPENDNEIVIEEIHPSQSLTEKILNSIKMKKEKSKSSSLNLLAGESLDEISTHVPTKVITLKVPIMKDAEGKLKLYSKQELQKVTKLVLNAFNEINNYNKANAPQASKMDTTVNGCKTLEDEDMKEEMPSMEELSNHGSTADQSTVVNDMPDLNTVKTDQCKVENSPKTCSLDNSVVSDAANPMAMEKSTPQHSGFKPFPLKSFNATSNNSLD